MSTPSNPGAPVTPTAASSGPSGSADDKKEQAKQVAGTAADEAKQTAAVAKEEAANVAATAKDEARHVVEESRQQAMNLLDEARSQVDEQARSQRDRVVGMLRTFGDDFEKMASGEQVEGGMAQDLARQVAERARDFGSRIDGREPNEILDEVRAFARRKPGTFLLGALAAGVVAGRVTRGAKEAGSQQSGSSQGSGTSYGVTGGVHAGRADLTGSGLGVGTGTAAGDPLSGVPQPSTTPVYPAGSGTAEPGTTFDRPLSGEGLTGGGPTTDPGGIR